MDDFGHDSGSDWDEAGQSQSGRFLVEDLTRCGHGRRGERVARRVDFSTASDLFGASVAGVLGGGLGGVGTGSPVPTLGIGGAARVVPTLPQTPLRTSHVGGKGRGTRVAVEDVDMGGPNFGGVVPASGREEGRSRCDCRTILAGVRREMASQVRRISEKVMGAMSLLLAEHGLGTWEEGRRLEKTRGRLERERVATQKEHEVMKVAEKVSAEATRHVAKEHEAAVEVEAAAKRQDTEGVAGAEKLAALRKNLNVAAESVRGAKTDADRSAGCEVLVVAHEQVKKVEASNPVSLEVVAAGP